MSAFHSRGEVTSSNTLLSPAEKAVGDRELRDPVKGDSQDLVRTERLLSLALSLENVLSALKEAEGSKKLRL